MARRPTRALRQKMYEMAASLGEGQIPSSMPQIRIKKHPRHSGQHFGMPTPLEDLTALLVAFNENPTTPNAVAIQNFIEINVMEQPFSDNWPDEMAVIPNKGPQTVRIELDDYADGFDGLILDVTFDRDRIPGTVIDINTYEYAANTAILMANGDVWHMGDPVSDSGILDQFGNEIDWHEWPVKVGNVPGGEKIVCQDGAIYVLTSDGDLYRKGFYADPSGPYFKGTHTIIVGGNDPYDSYKASIAEEFELVDHPQPITSISGGGSFLVMLDDFGTPLGLGYASLGAIGDGGTPRQVQVGVELRDVAYYATTPCTMSIMEEDGTPFPHAMVKMTANREHSYGIDFAGNVYSWGMASSTGTMRYCSSRSESSVAGSALESIYWPDHQPDSSDWAGATQVAASQITAWSIQVLPMFGQNVSTVVQYGWNSECEAGDGSHNGYSGCFTCCTSPFGVMDPASSTYSNARPPRVARNGPGWDDGGNLDYFTDIDEIVVAGSSQILVRKDDGTLWGWGSDNFGWDLGIPTPLGAVEAGKPIYTPGGCGYHIGYPFRMQHFESWSKIVFGDSRIGVGIRSGLARGFGSGEAVGSGFYGSTHDATGDQEYIEIQQEPYAIDVQVIDDGGGGGNESSDACYEVSNPDPNIAAYASDQLIAQINQEYGPLATAFPDEYQQVHDTGEDAQIDVTLDGVAMQLTLSRRQGTIVTFGQPTIGPILPTTSPTYTINQVEADENEAPLEAFTDAPDKIMEWQAFGGLTVEIDEVRVVRGAVSSSMTTTSYPSSGVGTNLDETALGTSEWGIRVKGRTVFDWGRLFYHSGVEADNYYQRGWIGNGYSARQPIVFGVVMRTASTLGNPVTDAHILNNWGAPRVAAATGPATLTGTVSFEETLAGATFEGQGIATELTFDTDATALYAGGIGNAVAGRRLAICVMTHDTLTDWRPGTDFGLPAAGFVDSGLYAPDTDPIRMTSPESVVDFGNRYVGPFQAFEPVATESPGPIEVYISACSFGSGSGNGNGNGDVDPPDPPPPPPPPEPPPIPPIEPDPEVFPPTDPDFPPDPDFQSDPWDNPFPGGGNIKFDPDLPPIIEVDYPYPEPPPIGEQFQFTPPDPFPDTPFEAPEGYPNLWEAPIQDWNFTDPSLDPCNYGMPDFGGGVCGPREPGGSDWPGGGTGGGLTDGEWGSGPWFDGGGGHIGGIGGGGGGGGGKYTDKEICFDNELATDIIIQMATELGLDPAKVIINPDGTPCNERYTGCFPKGTNKFDILKQMAALCGYGVIDPGDGVIVLPPEPRNVHHHLTDFDSIFVMERNYSDIDLYHHVEAFRPEAVIGGRYYPTISRLSQPIATPFVADPESVKYFQITDYNLSANQIQNIANLEAKKLSGMGAMVQVTTLWQYGYPFALYDQLHLWRFMMGWYTRWMIRSIEHNFDGDGHLTIAQASWLGEDPTPSPLPPSVNTGAAIRGQMGDYKTWENTNPWLG